MMVKTLMTKHNSGHQAGLSKADWSL